MFYLLHQQHYSLEKGNEGYHSKYNKDVTNKLNKSPVQ